MTLTFKKSSLIALAFVCASSASFADGPKVDITSYVYVDNGGRVAELCGKVTGASAPTLVRLVVDVNTSNPAVYNTMAGKDGSFCALVATYQGTATASLDPTQTKSQVVSVQSGPAR